MLLENRRVPFLATLPLCFRLLKLIFFLSACSTGSSARRARRVEGNAVCDLVNASLSLLSLLVVFVDFAVGFWFSFLAFFLVTLDALPGGAGGLIKEREFAALI